MQRNEQNLASVASSSGRRVKPVDRPETGLVQGYGQQIHHLGGGLRHPHPGASYDGGAGDRAGPDGRQSRIQRRPVPGFQGTPSVHRVGTGTEVHYGVSALAGGSDAKRKTSLSVFCKSCRKRVISLMNHQSLM